MVLRFAEHKSDIVFSIYGINTNICQILQRKCHFNGTHKVEMSPNIDFISKVVS